MRQLFLTLLLILCYSASQSQVTLSFETDTNTIRIGEPLTFKITLSNLPSASANIIFPNISDSSSAIEVLKSKTDTNFTSEKLSLARYITVTSFEDTSSVTIPSLPVIVDKDTLYTPAYLFSIQAVKIDTSNAIYGIKEPLNVSFGIVDWLEAYWPWLTGTVVGIAVLLLVFLYFRNKKTVEVIEKVPEIPLHELFISKLEKLKAEKSWQKTGLKGFHTEISIITREYIEKRFSIGALEQTSTEILNNLRVSGLDNDDIQIINQTLNLADLVKFAKESPDDVQNTKSVDDAISFILKYKSTSNLSNDA